LNKTKLNIRKAMHLIRQLFPYPGGKWVIRNKVTSHFPENYSRYIDVFGGSASILIAKEPSLVEIFNDLNEEIANFFRVVKWRAAELAELAYSWVHSRKLWEDLKKESPINHEVERAFRFWAMMRDSFGGKGEHFAMQKSKTVKSITKAREYLFEVSERFKNVTIESLHFIKCISCYDSIDSFLYLDPPYRDTKGADKNYSELTDTEWYHMEESLSNLQGKFCLSHIKNEFVKKLFSKFNFKEIEVPVLLSGKGNSRKRIEYLITNY